MKFRFKRVNLNKLADFYQSLLREETVKFKLTSNLFSWAVIFSLVISSYWLFIASDRYVSEAHVIIQRTDINGGSQRVDLSNVFGLSDSNRNDQMLLRDYLLSVDMLKRIDSKLNLKAHYSDGSHDLLSRMWFKQPSIEWFHRHFLSRVSVVYDDYDGVLTIKAQAYDPKTANAIVKNLVDDGSFYMNQLAQKLAYSQVVFLENQVTKLADESIKARNAMLDYQNKKKMVSPEAETENMLNIIAKLKQERAELETQKNALKAYLVAKHPNIVIIDQKIASIDAQIRDQQSKLTSPHEVTLNKTVEEYQRLELQAGIAQEVYKSALSALERGRIEAIRTIKTVSVIQAPTFPEYPLEPRRIYNVFVTILLSFLIAGLINLALAILRDHKD